MYQGGDLFHQSVNRWLKVFTTSMGWKLELHCYVFRHTAMTLAIEGGLNTSYVSMLSGCNPRCIQENYYNVMNEKTYRNYTKFLRR